MLYVLFLASVATAEILTLIKEKNITCVLTEDNVSSTIYLNPPTESGFLNQPAEINNWTIDDWTKVNSVDTKQNVVTDKRWEDFTMRHEDSGYALKDNSLPFSVCVTGNFSLNVFNSNFFEETWLQITPSHMNFSKNKNSCQWLHYTLTKQGTTINLISSENVQTFDVMFVPYWVYIKSPLGGETFWKLHSYEFRTAATPTQEQESKVSVNFTDNLCLSMYVSVDKNSFLDVVLETSDNITKRTIIGFNEEKALKKWQRIEIEAPSFGEGNVSFFRGLTQQGNQAGYWAVDKISFCSKSIEVVTASLKDEAPGDYICESLDQDEFAEDTSLNILRCDKPGFLGEDCSISCSTVLGSSYSYCENHKICQNATSCFCSWGYRGKECSQSCAAGTWGLFCKNRCTRECSQKCHPSTGKCLALESLFPEETVVKVAARFAEITLTEDLPVNMTITTNKISISLPNFEKNISDMSYKIKYICTSFWCRDQVFENYTIEAPSQNFVVRKFENFVPLTEYQANVTVQGFNQSLEKQYRIVRTDDVYAVENVSIFSGNSSSLWIRFAVSEVSNVGSPYKLWYHEIDSDSRPKTIETVFPCKLWEKFLCARIDGLEKETLYSIMVEHIETQHQKWGLSKTVLGFTSESISNAPENLRVLGGSDGEAIVMWDHPIITNGPIGKFDIDIQIKENVTSYTVDVVEPQKIYRFKIPVEYNTQYTISVRGFNKYEGKKSTITVTFTPFIAEFSSHGAIIQICNETCYMLVPKPEALQDTSNYEIVGIPGSDTSANIQKLLNNKVEPSQQGWLHLEDLGSNEKYFTCNIGTVSERIVSLNNIKSYSLYLIQKNNNNDYSIYPIELLEEKIVDPATIISSLTYITLIIVLSLLLMLLLTLLLLRLQRKNPLKKNNFHQEYRMVEQNNLIPGVESQTQFTKIQTNVLEKYLKSVLLSGKDLIAQFRSLPAATRPMVHAFHPKNKNKNKDTENIPCNYF